MSTSSIPRGPGTAARQIRALAALASGGDDAEAAKAARVSTRTLKRWRTQPAFAAELDRLLRYQRDRIQAILGAQMERARIRVDEALDAVDADGAPLYSIRLRAAELAAGVYERISKRAEQLQAPPTGPLIILPPGTTRMALAIEANGGGNAPTLPALAGAIDVGPPIARDGLYVVPAIDDKPTAGGTIEAAGVPIEPAQPSPRAPDGLPPWWRGPRHGDVDRHST